LLRRLHSVSGRFTTEGTIGQEQLQDWFANRIKARRGPKKAIMAVAASILTAIYHMLKDGNLYQVLGSNHFQNRSKCQQTNRLIKRLADLGYDVALTPRTS